MSRPLLALAALSLSLAASLPARAQEQVDTLASFPIEGIAATVNDEPISFSDVRERARLLLLGIGAEPDQALLERVTNEAREQLIEERLQLQKAAEFELTIEDASVRAEMAQLAEANGTDVDTFYKGLLDIGVNPASLESQTRAQIAWRRIMQGLYGSRVRISPVQIDDRMRMLQVGATQTRYQLGEIFLYAPDEERLAQAREFATALYEQLQSGQANFPAIAQRFSAAATAATGGDMGWVSQAELLPEVIAAFSTMEGPGFAPPVETANGIYLYAVRARQEPQQARPVVTLKQIVARDGNAASFDSVRQAGVTCASVDAFVASDDNLSVIDIGQVDPATLNEENQARITATPVGAISEPFTVRSGLAATMVCDRSTAGIDMPTRDQIENQLYGQTLALISDRELRNLKREAMVVRR